MVGVRLLKGNTKRDPFAWGTGIRDWGPGEPEGVKDKGEIGGRERKANNKQCFHIVHTYVP